MSLLPDCKDVSRLLSEARDSGRPLGSHVRLHLWVCEVCRRVKAQFDLLGRAAKACGDSGPGLSAEAKERLRRRLRSQGL